MASQEPLLTGGGSGSSGGTPGFFANLVGKDEGAWHTVWRGGGSNRRVWKAFCSCLIVFVFLVYCYVVEYRIDGGDADEELQKSLLFLMTGIFTAKLLIETWGQDTPTWVCPGGWVMFVLIYTGIFPAIVYSDGYCVANPDLVTNNNASDKFSYGVFSSKFQQSIVGFGLYIFGSSYSLYYEMNRFAWKKKAENKGKLHTIGLAKYCIHPNYFGEFTYSGWAAVAGTSCAFAVPFSMVASFAFIVCPNSDAYLSERYAEEWPAYAANTATLIPGLTNIWAFRALGLLCLVAGFFLGANCAGQC